MSQKELKSETFFRLYNAAQQRIYSYLLMMVHNRNDAEDLLQETASILWERFEEYDKSKSFAAWSVGIARNKALDLLKAKRNSRAVFKDGFYVDISKIAELEPEDADQRLKALRGCVAKLSIPNQKIVHLRFEKKVAIKDMSQISGHSSDAIYKKLSRIYSALRDCISQTLVRWETM